MEKKKQLQKSSSADHEALRSETQAIYDYPALTLTYFIARTNWDAYTFERVNFLQSHLMGKTCSKGPN